MRQVEYTMQNDKGVNSTCNTEPLDKDGGNKRAHTFGMSIAACPAYPCRGALARTLRYQCGQKLDRKANIFCNCF